MGLPPLPWGCELSRNPRNRGFAAACNQGARRGSAHLILFLNPDTTVLPDTIRSGAELLARRPTVGICGVRLIDHEGDLLLAAARFPSLRSYVGRITGLSRVFPRLFPPHFLSAEECKASRAVDQVSGAFFMVRRRLFEDLGGFDERFFVYYEDADFSYRAYRRGFVSWYLADAVCVHEGGVSSGSVPARRLYYNIASQIKYAHKHLGRGRAAAMVVLSGAVELPMRLVRAATRLSPSDATATLAAYGLLVRALAIGLARRGKSVSGERDCSDTASESPRL
jgi:hypothetical protein